MLALATQKNKKLHGIHYTPKALADYLASRMVRYLPKIEGPVRVLDPAVGEGELLSALIDVCISRKIDVRAEGFDTDEIAATEAKIRLRQLLPSDRVLIKTIDFLDEARRPASPMLFSEAAHPAFADAVIANPPYVRTQALGMARTHAMTEKFSLSGRVDIYQAFIKAISWSLSSGGIAGLIIPNRFMSVRAGADIRAYILTHFDVLEVWDMGDTRLFEAAVLPAILILRKNDKTFDTTNTLFQSVYRTEFPATTVVRHVNDVCDALRESGFAKTRAGDMLCVQHGTLDHGDSLSGVWRLSTHSGDDWLKTVAKHTFCKFRDVGKIRVGVKTTADSIYLRREWASDETPELLRPVTTHHVARSYHAHAVTRKILYPHIVEHGKRTAVNLDRYPISRRYLENYRSELEKRTYLMSSGRQWFELWVPQSPEMWSLPKVVFRDISEKPTFWMDLDGTVVNGDCYWIVSEGGDSELLWLLLAVANSRFIEDFYDHSFNNKLYAGRRRFMTQYVETFPLPDPRSAIARGLVDEVKLIYQGLAKGKDMSEEQRRLEEDVYRSFGIKLPEESVSSVAVSEVSDSEYYPRSA